MNYQKEITEFLQHILESNHIPVHYINLPYEENTIINLDMGLREKILQFENIKKSHTSDFFKNSHSNPQRDLFSLMVLPPQLSNFLHR